MQSPIKLIKLISSESFDGSYEHPSRFVMQHEVTGRWENRLGWRAIAAHDLWSSLAALDPQKKVGRRETTNLVMRRDSPLRNLRLRIAVLIAHSCAARGELIDLGFSLSEFHEMEFLIRKRVILWRWQVLLIYWLASCLESRYRSWWTIETQSVCVLMHFMFRLMCFAPTNLFPQ